MAVVDAPVLNDTNTSAWLPSATPTTPVFDPYHKWLGIPPGDQPPHHYRLLGLEPFESEPDVISHAADQRMAFVKGFQAGPHGDLSQQLLNELAAARLCLLDPEAKSDYDAQLGQQRGVFPIRIDCCAPIRRRRRSRIGELASILMAAAIAALLLGSMAALSAINAWAKTTFPLP